MFYNHLHKLLIFVCVKVCSYLLQCSDWMKGQSQAGQLDRYWMTA